MTAIDPMIARFAHECGAQFPLDLQIDLLKGELLARGMVHQPFTLVGRDDSCDVTLADPEIHLRHCWLQVIDGRIFAIDLGSRRGLVWPSGENHRSGWLDAGCGVRIGPFLLRVCSPASNNPQNGEAAADPLQSLIATKSTVSAVQLEFLNGKSTRNQWIVNRSITLIGRSDACKIHLNADDISAYHCGLVLTSAGLWVVDLSGRGVVVNGERMRVSPLEPEAEFYVGRFLMSCRYLQPDQWGPASDHASDSVPTTPEGIVLAQVMPRSSCAFPATTSMPNARPGTPPPTQVTPVLPLFAEDEVPIGGILFSDSATGLPSSHIMCDAFPSEPAEVHSDPILLSKTAKPTPNATSPLAVPSEGAGPDSTRFASIKAAGLEAGINAILQQLSKAYGQMTQQLHDSLRLFVRICDSVMPDRSPFVLRELTRIQALNSEIASLQEEIARTSMWEMIFSFGRRTGQDGVPEQPSPGDHEPEGPPIRTTDRAINGDLIQHGMHERMIALQSERRDAWNVLTALLAGAHDEQGS